MPDMSDDERTVFYQNIEQRYDEIVAAREARDREVAYHTGMHDKIVTVAADQIVRHNLRTSRLRSEQDEYNRLFDSTKNALLGITPGAPAEQAPEPAPRQESGAHVAPTPAPNEHGNPRQSRGGLRALHDMLNRQAES